MLPWLDGEHREDAVRFRISGDVTLGMTAGRAAGTRVELRGTAAEAVATARGLRQEGHLNVRITDAATGELCDETSLERGPGAEAR